MIILRQKEYTSLGRRINAKIGRLRVNAANHMYKKARMNLVKSKRQAHKLDVQNRLTSQADLDNSPNCGYRFGEYLKDIAEKRLNIPVNYGSKFSLSVDNRITADPLSKAYGPGIAHEMGHYLVNTGNAGSRATKSRKEFERTIPKYRNLVGNTSNVRLKDLLTINKGNRLILQNERDASKTGKSLLSSTGATKEELKFAKDYFKEAEKTYKFGNRERSYKGIGNMINLKGRLQNRTMYRNSDIRLIGVADIVPVNMKKFEVERNIARKKRRNRK